MGKIVIGVIPAADEARIKAKYPNPPPEADPDVVPVSAHDPTKVVEVIKAQPEKPVGVIVTSFFPESVQNEVKAAVEAGAPGVPVLVIPQGLSDDEVQKFLNDAKLKHDAGKA